MIKLFIGALVLILGFPIGTYLANSAKEELKSGQKWFRIITFSCLGAGFIALVIKNDMLMFSFFFIALVTSRSLKGKKQSRKI
jgi:hypothetical protein